MPYTRLHQLLAERQAHPERQPAIEQQIWAEFGCIQAILYTDLAGFSRGVADFGIVHFLQLILESRQLFLPLVHAHQGRFLKEEGDSLLLLFDNPVQAACCAQAMQHVSHHHNAGRPPEQRIDLCLGLGYGQVLRIGQHDVFGEEVNAACKLGEDVAGPGDILLTAAMRTALLASMPADALPPMPERAGWPSVYRLSWQ